MTTQKESIPNLDEANVQTKIETFDFEEWQKQDVVNQQDNNDPKEFANLENIINSAVIQHLEADGKKPESVKLLLMDFVTKLHDQEVAKSDDIEAAIAPSNQEDSHEIIEETTKLKENDINLIDNTVETVEIKTNDVPAQLENKDKPDIAVTENDNILAQENEEEKTQEEIVTPPPPNPQEILINSLLQQLDNLSQDRSFEKEVAEITAETIKSIANKLHLTLPADFKKIIQEGLLNKLRRFYVEGKITLSVHPTKEDLCKQILHSEEIESKFKDNIIILTDKDSGEDDCKMQIHNTTLKYNKDELGEEIERIITRLQNIS